jgi:uncharacterized protein YyaL (SSP411 family)
MNHLKSEKSPYLLHHAGNPVNWYPWGDAAFQKASTENKPIILSIGYSTCHWCHVMERESFENNEIAALMNDHFVSIKVDREERPDIDQIYMASVTAMTGHGGWPLTVFLTPEKKPFYGGTYFPAYAKWGSPSFSEILKSIQHTWQTNQGQAVASSIELTEHLKQRFITHQNDSPLSEIQLDQMYNRLKSHFDSTHGGFSQAPKFPMGHTLSLLLRYWRRTGKQEALDMVLLTLHSMANGGIYDHLGGGFHRYSTDQLWHVPHFEKMLYDQALLVRVYLEAYQITGHEYFADISREVLDYVLREMTDPMGGFYSAQDADSVDSATGEKKEGAFYVWSLNEIMAELPPQSSEIMAYHFGVQKDGNAEEDPHGEFTAKNILSVVHSQEETAKNFKLESGLVGNILKEAKVKLKSARAQRPSPHLDDKVMVDWNGLMMSSFAFAAGVLQEKRYADAAKRSADFILNHLIDRSGRLLHRYRDGQAGISATLEDYAFFIAGLLDLYETSLEFEYFVRAQELTADMIALFEDKEHGGFYLTGHDAEALIVRSKETYDGALPSGNSSAVMALLRMYHWTADETYKKISDRALNSFSSTVSEHPEAYCVLLAALDFQLGPVDELVLCGSHDHLEFKAMHQRIFKEFRPNRIVASHPADFKNSAQAIERMPILNNRVQTDGKNIAAYLCRDSVCLMPSKNIIEWHDILVANKPSLRA